SGPLDARRRCGPRRCDAPSGHGLQGRDRTRPRPAGTPGDSPSRAIGSRPRMRRRLFALLVVALVSGTVAGTVASAKGRLDAVAARIPPLPALREVANTCPV